MWDVSMVALKGNYIDNDILKTLSQTHTDFAENTCDSDYEGLNCPVCHIGHIVFASGNSEALTMKKPRKDVLETLYTALYKPSPHLLDIIRPPIS
jgi:hypothetical protein